MNSLKDQIAALPTAAVGGQQYLSYQAATDTVAAFLFPTHPTDEMDAAGYQHILETADTLCRELGYQEVVKLTPPDVDFSDMGLYWSTEPTPAPSPAPKPEPDIIHVGPGRVEMMQDGLLLDARLSQLGLDEVTRQHFKIPVTASDGVIDLMHRAVASEVSEVSDWPNDYKGIWHDVLGMCIAGGKDINPTERLFTVIIRGVGNRRYWRMKATLKHDHLGAVYLCIALADESDSVELFELGHVVMTPGAAALEVDFAPFLAKHSHADWGDLDNFDKRQNDIAVKEGLRVLSAYDVPVGNRKTERIWIITEADRSCTTVLLPSEY
jgi:hypothetical protein